MTLKGIIDHFQQDLNDRGSTLTAIEETICIMSKSTKRTSIYHWT